MTAMDADLEAPRISFSHHLSYTDGSFSTTPDCPYRSESNSDDFHFCNFEGETVAASSADEIFSNGFILPLQTKPEASGSSSGEILKQVKSRSKPFWRILKRSSLQCENGQYKRGSVWSFQHLSRSYSTGSSEQAKKEKENRHRLKSASCSSASVYSFYEFPLSSQKPPFRSNLGNGAVRINPVLNVPPPSCISMGTKNLFGLGSLFKSGKDKKSSKK